MARIENKLTEKQLLALSVKDKGGKLSDGGGLTGIVSIGRDNKPTVSFTYQFRIGENRRGKRVGTWPKSGLAEIRAARNNLRSMVDKGIDPIEAERAEEVAAQQEALATSIQQSSSITWNELFDKWDAEYAVTLEPHWREARRSQWRCHLSPSIGNLKLPEASKQPVLSHYDAKVREGKEATARKAIALMIQLVKWSVDRQYLAEDHPLTRLTMPLKKKIVREDQKPENFDIQEFIAKHGEDAIGNDHEIDAVGRALQFHELTALLHDQLPQSGQAETGKCIIRLMLATGIRAAECVRLRWKWIDLDRRLMIFPSGATKRRKNHHVHLSEYAAEQIQAMLALKKNDFVFPAPIKENSAVLRTNVGTDITARQFYREPDETDQQFEARVAKRKQCRRSRADFQRYNLAGGKWTLYDMRRTAATRLEELGYDREMVRAILSHSKEDAATTGRYARFSHWEKRCAALDTLGTALAECEAGNLPSIAAGNVIVLKPAA